MELYICCVHYIFHSTSLASNVKQACICTLPSDLGITISDWMRWQLIVWTIFVQLELFLVGKTMTTNNFSALFFLYFTLDPFTVKYENDARMFIINSLKGNPSPNWFSMHIEVFLEGSDYMCSTCPYTHASVPCGFSEFDVIKTLWVTPFLA